MPSAAIDAIIIGAGQGGSPLAHKLADLNWKVALIEKEHLGGSCINYGCTPTKAMITSARLAHYARRASELGVHNRIRPRKCSPWPTQAILGIMLAIGAPAPEVRLKTITGECDRN